MEAKLDKRVSTHDDGRALGNPDFPFLCVIAVEAAPRAPVAAGPAELGPDHASPSGGRYGRKHRFSGRSRERILACPAISISNVAVPL